jgi:hypothetical protein
MVVQSLSDCILGLFSFHIHGLLTKLAKVDVERFVKFLTLHIPLLTLHIPLKI